MKPRAPLQDLLRCRRCGKNIADRRYPLLIDATNPRCPKCIFKSLASRHLRKSGSWTALRDLFVRQGFRCAYSGCHLVLGGNATIDHRIPKSKGGKCTIDNLQWVTGEINDLKGCTNHDDFLRLCKAVSSCSAVQ